MGSITTPIFSARSLMASGFRSGVGMGPVCRSAPGNTKTAAAILDIRNDRYYFSFT